MTHPLHRTPHTPSALHLDEARAAALYRSLHQRAQAHHHRGNVDEASALLESAARIRHHFLSHFEVDLHVG